MVAAGNQDVTLTLVGAGGTFASTTVTDQTGLFNVQFAEDRLFPGPSGDYSLTVSHSPSAEVWQAPDDITTTITIIPVSLGVGTYRNSVLGPSAKPGDPKHERTWGRIHYAPFVIAGTPPRWPITETTPLYDEDGGPFAGLFMMTEIPEYLALMDENNVLDAVRMDVWITVSKVPHQKWSPGGPGRLHH